VTDVIDVDPDDMPNLDEIIMACSPTNPEQYDSARKKMWDSAVTSGLPIPPRYPGSIHKPCMICGVTVQVGPRQQEAIEKHRDKRILLLCLIDAVVYSQRNVEPGQPIPMSNLNNPYQERK